MSITVIASLIAVAINIVTGTLIAWVLVRDEFPGKRFVNALIETCPSRSRRSSPGSC